MMPAGEQWVVEAPLGTTDVDVGLHCQRDTGRDA